MDPIGSVLEDKFAAVGTGAEVAMGVLESEYREGLSVDEARPLILRAIRSALARDISSGDGVDLLVITESGIKEESHKLVKEKNEKREPCFNTAKLSGAEARNMLSKKNLTSIHKD